LRTPMLSDYITFIILHHNNWIACSGWRNSKKNIIYYCNREIDFYLYWFLTCSIEQILNVTQRLCLVTKCQLIFGTTAYEFQYWVHVFDG
jgi:hypothetical protein